MAIGDLTRGTPIVWAASGGDRLLTLTSLAAGGVKVGAFYDVPFDGSLGLLEQWELSFQTAFAGGQSLLESVNLYFAASTGSEVFDGTLDTDPTDIAEGAANANQLVNLAGPFTVSAIDTVGGILKSTGLFPAGFKKVAPVVHNAAAATALSATAGDHKLILTPVYQATS